MKTGLFFFFLSSLITLSSCLKGEKNIIEKNNTTIYYEGPKDKLYAEQLLHFWIKNRFNGKRKQNLHLSKSKDNKMYILKVIIREGFDGKKIPFEDLKLFNDLQNELNSQIFKDVPCQIAISDKHFEVISIPNKLSF
mgnify:CR=1 FL=1|tara:strand:+ start:121 stop:531 length:411 start_codon:yes stop_codon:yes gene_type:complete